MKKYFGLFVVLMTTVLFQPSQAWAKEETEAVHSKKCNLDKLKSIGGQAIVKVEKSAWEDSYNVTLNTDKMSFKELLQKMTKAGCN